MNKGKKKSFFEKCREWFKERYVSFIKLPKKTRRILELWCIIVLILVIVIVVCNINNSYIGNYTGVEKKLATAAVEYVEDKDLAGVDSQKVKLDMTALIKEGYLKVDSKIEDECIGYALVFTNRDNEVRSTGYLLCKGYSTEGFSLE